MVTRVKDYPKQSPTPSQASSIGHFSHKLFINRINVTHDSGTFWLYGAVCLVGSFYTIFFVPETKGKSIEEIQQMFSSSPEEKRQGDKGQA